MSRNGNHRREAIQKHLSKPNNQTNDCFKALEIGNGKSMKEPN